MTTSEHTIEITKTANIEHALFRVRPGVNVLRGRNGAGKSAALAAVQAVLTGDATDLEVSRGTPEDERGVVRAFGVTLTLNRRRENIAADADRGRSRATGELEVAAMSGVDPLDLISPRGETIEVRDGKRMVALCRMLGIKPDIARFGAAAEYASPVTRRAADLPEMAGQLKRDVQAFARDTERSLATIEGEIRANLEAAGDVSDEPTDLVDWKGRARDLAPQLRDLETRQRVSNAARIAADAARRQLEEARASYTGPTVEQAVAAVEETSQRIAELRSALRTEEAKLSELKVTANAASRHERQLKAWEESISAGERAVAVDASEVEALRATLADALDNVDRAAVDTERRRRRKQAKELLATADAQRRTAEALREMASSIESVLTSAINETAACGLRVANGRLISDEFGDAYDCLSHGQRARIAVRIIARAFPSGRAVAVIPQEAGEAIDRANMEELDRIAREHDVVILTAAHDDGELRAEFFSATLN